MKASTLVIALLVGVVAAEIYLDERFDGNFFFFENEIKLRLKRMESCRVYRYILT